MRITVFGASGKVGRLVVAGALERGYHVTAFVHSTPQSFKHKNLTVVQGDIYEADSVTQAIKGSNVVVSALGSWGTSGKDVLSVAMQHIIPVMQELNISKVISLTGAGAEAAGDRPPFFITASRPFMKIAAGKILRDGERHIELLAESKLDWTVVRSPIMTGHGDAADYKLVFEYPKPWQTVNRQSVAEAMVDLIESAEYNRQAPFIVRSRS